MGIIWIIPIGSPPQEGSILFGDTIVPNIEQDYILPLGYSISILYHEHNISGFNHHKKATQEGCGSTIADGYARVFTQLLQERTASIPMSMGYVEGLIVEPSGAFSLSLSLSLFLSLSLSVFEGLNFRDVLNA